jgi:transcriptional regulator with XRE-family HTH domain
MKVVPLKTARTLKGWTQVELARRSGVSQRTVTDIERGIILNPTWETANRLASALGVEPQQIFAIPQIPVEASR